MISILRFNLMNLRVSMKTILLIVLKWRVIPIDKRIFKKEGEELQQYLHFRKLGSRVENKKGKGSYQRKPKHRRDDNQKCA